MDLVWAQKLAVWIVPVLLAITVHEAAHGWAANKLGDPTARMLGRLTLNPIKHIDPIGTILVPAMLLILGTGFLMGWAKPVPVGVRNLSKPRRDMALVAAAGPGANLLMALGWALIAKLAVEYHLAVTPTAIINGTVQFFFLCAGVAGIFINTLLMVINLLPIPPLDGGRVLAGIVPPRISSFLDSMERYGLMIVLVLLFTGSLSWLISPALDAVVLFILTLLEVPLDIFNTVRYLIWPGGGGS